MNEQYPNLGHGPIRFEHETGGLEAAGIPDAEEWTKGASDSLQLLQKIEKHKEKRPSQGQRRTETRRLQDKAGNVVVAKVTEQYDAEKGTWNAVDVRAIREDKAGDDKGFRAVQNDPKTKRNEQRERGYEAILADAARRAEEAAKDRGKGLQGAINDAMQQKVGHSELEAGTGINIERSPTGKVIISGKLPKGGATEEDPFELCIPQFWPGARDKIPTRWKECDGSALVEANNPVLYAYYGANLPDMREVVPIGWKTGGDFATVGRPGGLSWSHGHTASDHAAHSHDLGNHTHDLGNHTHDLSSHTHSVADHTHGIGLHTHDLANSAVGVAAGTDNVLPLWTTTGPSPDATASGGAGTSGAPSSNTSGTPSSNTSGYPSSNITNEVAALSHSINSTKDIPPCYVGTWVVRNV